MAIRSTHKCHICKEIFKNEDMVNYATPRAKTSYWYCKKCYDEKIAQEKFSNKVCSIFGIKTPGPRIWTERKRLMDTYGYSDETIVDCLDYIYNVEKKKKFAETLYLINPATMDKMKAYQREKNNESLKLAAATTTKFNEYIAPIQANKNKVKIEYDPDEWLD